MILVISQQMEVVKQNIQLEPCQSSCQTKLCVNHKDTKLQFVQFIYC